MGPVTTLPAPRDGWTVEDLDHVPDDGLRYELVDGALLVSPPATNIHDYVVLELAVLLRKALSDPWRVITGGGIRFDARNYRAADLMVVQKAALTRDMAEPQDVLLAVEVMSPGSVTNDRLVKPVQYAAAGIAHYWRLELGEVPVLVTHRLEADVYRESGRFDDEFVLGEPVHLAFRLPDLLS